MKKVFIEGLNYVSSATNIKRLRTKNYKKDTIDFINSFTRFDPETIFQDIDGKIQIMKDKLRQLYEKEEVLYIAFSGGKDSTLLCTLLRMVFPSKRIVLLTAVTGFSHNVTNVQHQARQIENKTPEAGTLEHLFIDISYIFDKNVTSMAFQDRERLGFPGICSSCKIAMELSIMYYLASHDPVSETINVLWGYITDQSNQQWPEQKPEFRSEMDSFISDLDEDLTRVKNASPIFEFVANPFDSMLMLSYIGYYPDEFKSEGKCKGGGLNPVSIRENVLGPFVRYKAEKIFKELRLDKIVSHPVPPKQLLVIPEDDFVYNDHYRSGTFQEQKFQMAGN